MRVAVACMQTSPTVEPYFLEHPAISNSNPFPLLLFLSHLLSAISNSPLSQIVFCFPREFEIAGFNCASLLHWSHVVCLVIRIIYSTFKLHRKEIDVGY